MRISELTAIVYGISGHSVVVLSTWHGMYGSFISEPQFVALSINPNKNLRPFKRKRLGTLGYKFAIDV